MARDVQKLPPSKQQNVDILVNTYNKGVVSLVDESLLPEGSAVEAVNLMLEQDGRWRPRWGKAYYGVDAGGSLEGAFEFVDEDESTDLVVIAGTACKRSLDDGATWNSCTGQTFTADTTVNGLQIKSFLYLFNGVDTLTRYDGSTTLQTYTSLAAPAWAATPLARTGLSAGSFTYYYQVTAVNEVGESVGSTEQNITVNKTRDDWDTSNYLTLDWNSVAGASRYNVYVADEAGNEVYLDSTTNTGYEDKGAVAPNPYIEVPLDNTTTGPKFRQAELSGNRIWATDDPDNPWRVWWGGSGQYQGFFSAFYGGGWVELEKGGRERPRKVVHYRDGRGNAFATVFSSDPAGKGSIWQIGLEETTIGDTTFLIPVPVKIVGSVGTTSPLSVIPVRNDSYFFNEQGMFSLGSRAQLLNLLSTDEISINIRPDIRSLTGAALSGVCSHYNDGKVFVSVPLGADTNNQIMVYDVERRAWNPKAFDFGVERFFDYTDGDGNTHMLAIPVGGTRLVELSRDIVGDFGAAIPTSYKSPIIHVTKDRVGYARIKRYWIELGRAVGTIRIEFLGTQKRSSFSSVSSAVIQALSSQVGWSFSGGWSNTLVWSDSDAPNNFSEASLKRFKRMSKLLNNIQFRVSSEDVNADWTLHQLKAEGFVVPTRPPSSQKL